LCAVAGFAGVEWVGVINVRAVPVQVLAASQPQPIKRAAVLGAVKAEPFGWPRKRGQP